MKLFNNPAIRKLIQMLQYEEPKYQLRPFGAVSKIRAVAGAVDTIYLLPVQNIL
jgi:hypothetical protein